MAGRFVAEIDALLEADDPSLRYLVRRDLLDEDPSAAAMRTLAASIRSSARVSALLEGCVRSGAHTYGKWQGAHWVLLHLADLGHPGDDARVDVLIEQSLAHWTAPRYLLDREVTRVSSADRFVPVVAGKPRRCASQQGGALFAVLRLGRAADRRVPVLADRLCDWQWPDGGWNCDRRPAARMSSVNESFLPLRGLAALGDRPEETARAAGFFLDREVAFRRSTGEPINRAVVALHYPAYWHYDLLAGLTALAEGGFVTDVRCSRALDLLERFRLPAGGWPAHARWYRVATTGSNVDSVAWGPTGRTRPNAWVTLAALRVLKAAGRFWSPGIPPGIRRFYSR